MSGRIQRLESGPYNELKSPFPRLPFLCFLELPGNESPIRTLSTFKDNDGTTEETESRRAYFQ